MDIHHELAEGLTAQRLRVGDDDAVQDGFLKVLAGGAADLDNPGGYWYVASRNSLRDRLRKEASERRAVGIWLEIQRFEGRPHYGLPGCEHRDELGPSPGTPDDSDRRLEALHRSVASLRGRRRQLVELELEGVRSVAKLSERLGISPGATRVLRHRTYRQLRGRLLGDGCDEHPIN